MRLAAIALAAAALVGWAGGAWASGITIAEALRRPDYAETYNRMMTTGGGFQAWFGSAATAVHGRDQSFSAVDVDGTQMFLITFCEPRYCDSGSFAVLFSTDGRRAVGASDINGALQLFGGPSVFETERLTGAFIP